SSSSVLAPVRPALLRLDRHAQVVAGLPAAEQRRPAAVQTPRQRDGTPNLATRPDVAQPLPIRRRRLQLSGVRGRGAGPVVEGGIRGGAALGRVPLKRATPRTRDA